MIHIYLYRAIPQEDGEFPSSDVLLCFVISFIEFNDLVLQNHCHGLLKRVSGKLTSGLINVIAFAKHICKRMCAEGIQHF